jgi:hypothetical protein
MLHSFMASSLTIPFYYPTNPMFFLLLVSIFFFNNDRGEGEKE